MNTKSSLRDSVLKFCTKIAADPLLVQGAGGNVSWKDGATLWVKASGTWLADAQNDEIFVPVDRQAIDEALARGDYSVNPMALEGFELRPSIETLLHVLMPYKFVVHLHLVDAVVYLTRNNCQVELQTKLGDTISWDLVNYYMPGADLAQAIHSSLSAQPGIQVLLLKNHGVVLGAQTIEEIERDLKTLCRYLCNEPRPFDSDKHATAKRAIAALDGTAYRFCLDESLHLLATDPELYDHLAVSWAICPDHVVFLGAQAIRIDDLTALHRTLVAAADPAPPFVFVKGMGVLENRAVTRAQKVQLTFYLDVISRQPPGQRLESLSYEQIANLLNWDAEKYRLNFMRSAPHEEKNSVR